MLSKKQYIWMLVSASLIFIAIFVFSYIYTVTHIEPIVPDETEITKKEEGVSEEVAEASRDTSNITILPSTNVLIRVKDQYDNVLNEQVLEANSLVGLDEQAIAQMFRGYDIETFDHREVVLEKVEYVQTQELKYRLAIQDGEIGIATDGKEEFVNLGLPTKDFSKKTNLLIINGLVSISASQKNSLEKDPDYIEYILQNLSE
ncbi:MAG: hypothetical protein ACRC1P_10585 [Cellulosilyticaceae bacterium]